MKKRLALAVLFVIVASPGAAADIRLGVRGGLGYSGLGDIGQGIVGYSNYTADLYSGMQGGFKAPNLGFSLQGEVIVYFSSRWGIGFGAGFLRTGRNDSLSYTTADVSVQEQLKSVVSAVPITLNVHIFIPVSSNFRLDAWAGPAYYLTKLAWDDSQTVSVLGYRGTDRFQFNASQGAFGAQAGVGLEYGLWKGVDLVLTCSGRYAAVKSSSGFKGDWTETGSGDFWDFSDSGSTTAWAYDWTSNGRTYRLLAFNDAKPSGTAISASDYAKLNLTGFEVTFGVKVRLPF